MAFRSIFITAMLLACASAQMMPLKWADVLSAENKPFDSVGGNFDILSKLVRFAGLAETITTARGYTLFAPNDQAFVYTARAITAFAGPITDEAAAFDALVAFVTTGVTIGNMTVSGVPLVKEILLYHVSPFRASSQYVLGHPLVFGTLSSLEGAKFISTGKGELVDNSPDTPNPKVVKADLMVENNFIIHVINAVLLPIPAEVPVAAYFCS